MKFIDTIVTATPDYLTQLPPEQVRRYFERALEFFSREVGAENIFSAVVHMDERNPHMHLCFVPLTKDHRLSAKEVINYLTLGEKNAQFLKLFHEEDQRAVEDWICRNRAEEPYTVPRRDRKSTLLYAVLDRARANGDLREIEPIWDYYLPNKNEPLSPDKDSYLTNYAFSAVSTIDFGCEGIYVELFLEGQFDESGNDRCSIGTFKTLRDDAEACRLMGQLCGVLMYHTAKYVNENLHRYTPKRELEAELHRKSAVTESTSEDSRHA